MVHKQELHELILIRTLSKASGLFEFIIPPMNSPYKTSIDERLIFYNITRSCEHHHPFAIAAGDIKNIRAVT